MNERMKRSALFTTRDVADAFGTSTDTILRRIADGSLHAIRFGGRWLIARETVDAWLTAARGQR